MRRVAIAVAALAAACSFPDVTFGPGGAGDGGGDAPATAPDATSGDEGVTEDAGADDATAGDDARPDAGRDATPEAAADTGANDAPAEAAADTGTDAGTDAGVDAGTDAGVDAADSGDPCDNDRDTYKAKGGVCGGLDCDDNDARRNPGVTTYQTYVTSNGDWNCDNRVDLQYTPNVVCSSFLLPATCNAAAGFTGAPACGAMGTYNACTWDLVNGLCHAASTRSDTQGCL
jgi:hypothetical protein